MLNQIPQEGQGKAEGKGFMQCRELEDLLQALAPLDKPLLIIHLRQAD